MDIEILLRQFGYIALFIGTMLEGETFLFMAGLAAANGLLTIEIVFPVAFFGAVTGDQIPFFLGRLKGRTILKNKPDWGRRSKVVMKKIIKHRIKILLFYRFIYGLRGITPFVFGLSSMSIKCFVLVNTFVALVWTMIVGLLGYYFGRFLVRYAPDFKYLQLAAGALAIILIFGIWAVSRHKKARLAEPEREE